MSPNPFPYLFSCLTPDHINPVPQVPSIPSFYLFPAGTHPLVYTNPDQGNSLGVHLPFATRRDTRDPITLAKTFSLHNRVCPSQTNLPNFWICDHYLMCPFPVLPFSFPRTIPTALHLQASYLHPFWTRCPPRPRLCLIYALMRMLPSTAIFLCHMLRSP